MKRSIANSALLSRRQLLAGAGGLGLGCAARMARRCRPGRLMHCPSYYPGWRSSRMDRVVYLSGEVSAGEFRDLAESAAHEVPGVMQVVNSISVTH
jgi:hypothetical protein